MTEIPQDLIEKALALCGKTMEDRDMETDYVASWAIFCFSMKSFLLFLLSPEFIEKYHELTADTINCHIVMTAEYVWMCIWMHQKWDSSALIYLLSKI